MKELAIIIWIIVLFTMVVLIYRNKRENNKIKKLATNLRSKFKQAYERKH